MVETQIVQLLSVLVALLAAVFAFAWIWETGRRAYFSIAAKYYGWDENQRLKRELAYLDRWEKRVAQRAELDKAASANFDRKRLGANLLMGVVGFIGYRAGLPWWQIFACAIVTHFAALMIGGASIK